MYWFELQDIFHVSRKYLLTWIIIWTKLTMVTLSIIYRYPFVAIHSASTAKYTLRRRYMSMNHSVSILQKLDCFFRGSFRLWTKDTSKLRIVLRISLLIHNLTQRSISWSAVAVSHVSNYFLQRTMDVIIYPCFNLSYSLLIKGAPDGKPNKEVSNYRRFSFCPHSLSQSSNTVHDKPFIWRNITCSVCRYL